jgi:hypothetical protein
VVHVVRHPGGGRAIDAVAELSGPTGLRSLYPGGPGAGPPTRPPRIPDVMPFDPGPAAPADGPAGQSWRSDPGGPR